MEATEQNPSFGLKGSEVSSQEEAEFLVKLDEIDTTVPQRTQGRRSHHRERYCGVRYLSTLAANSRLGFPLRVVKWESPDFFLHLPNLLVGLEITEAGTERSQQAATRLEKSPPGTFLEGEASLRLPGQPLQGRGYVGDEAELELVDLILRALEEKTAKLNDPHFEPAERYDLLIYDNSHLVLLADLWHLAPLAKSPLQAWQDKTQAERKFSTISVLRDSWLLYDCTGEACVLKVRGAS